MKSRFQPDGITWLQISRTGRYGCRADGLYAFRDRFSGHAGHSQYRPCSKVEEHDQYNVIIAKQIMGGEAMQVSLVQGADFVLTFQERDNDFFDDVMRAIRNNVLKIRTRQSDYLFSVCSMA